MLFGCIALGIIQLIALGLDLTQCLDSELLFLPALQFAFVFLLMHFVLLQARQSSRYFYNNIALAHLLATQLSIWLAHYQPNQHSCGYLRGWAGGRPQGSQPFGNQSHGSLSTGTQSGSFLRRMLDTAVGLTIPVEAVQNVTNTAGTGANHTSSINGSSISLPSSSPTNASLGSAAASVAQLTASSASSASTGNFGDLLPPVMQHYQLLIIFILLAVWTNNNRLRPNYLRARLCEPEPSTASCLAEAEFSSTGFLRAVGGGGRLQSLKGFFLGMLIISITIVVLVLGDDYVTILTHSSIQVSGPFKAFTTLH